VAVETAEALDSNHWLRMSKESVHEFLDMKFLNVQEAELVSALIRWGQNKLRSSNDAEDYFSKLRAEILPGLKLIRFAALTQQEFVGLCKLELGDVLSEEEQNLICQSIVDRNPSLMPAGIKSRIPLPLRSRPHAVCKLPFGRVQRCDDDPQATHRAKVSFQIDQKAILIGVKVNCHQFENCPLTFNLCRDDGNSTVMGKGKGESKICHGGERFVKVTHRRTLAPDTKYTLLVQQMFCPRMHTAYTMGENETTITSDWLNLTIVDPSENVDILVEGLLFEKVLD
jgi:hypothetical protein